MQAIEQERFGEPGEVLRLAEVPEPGIGDDEVLVAVRAVGISRGDWLITQGLPLVARPSYGLRTPKQRIPGLEFAGVVTAVGAAVTSHAPGDEVFGWGTGALAESAAVPAGNLAPKPGTVSFEQAAALPVSGLAALQAVRDRGEVAPGHRVLVTGASGGVGSFAVQIAASLGAEVTGVCSGRNADLVRSLGAAHVVDYTREEITDAGRSYDVIVDIAGNRPLTLLRRVLAERGTLVIVGSTGGRGMMGFGRTIRAMLLSPFVGQRLRSLLSSPNHDDLATLADLVAAGKVIPQVGATYPLAEAATAIAGLGAGTGRAKTVVTV